MDIKNVRRTIIMWKAENWYTQVHYCCKAKLNPASFDNERENVDLEKTNK